MDARVVRISVAPVKSLGLVHPDEVLMGAGGGVGDRRFWLRDDVGALYGGKRDGALLRIRPETDEETRRLALTFPDGRRAEGVVDVGRRLELLWADRDAAAGTSVGGTVSLVSRGSLDRLRPEIGGCGRDRRRRFRMLFEIDGIGAHEEDGRSGAEVQTERRESSSTAMSAAAWSPLWTPTQGWPTLQRLSRSWPTIRKGRPSACRSGSYGAVVVPGQVRVGDAVVPLRVGVAPATPAQNAGLTVACRAAAVPVDQERSSRAPAGGLLYKLAGAHMGSFGRMRGERHSRTLTHAQPRGRKEGNRQRQLMPCLAVEPHI